MKAMQYLQKAAKLDPNMSEPHINMAALILDAEAEIVEEMNGLGTSSADNERYDELKEKRIELYQKAIPYLEKAFRLKPDIDTARTLRDIYSAALMTDKYKEMKAKIADMEASGN